MRKHASDAYSFAFGGVSRRTAHDRDNEVAARERRDSDVNLRNTVDA